MKRQLAGADYFFWRTIAQNLMDNESVTAVYTGIEGSNLNPVVRSKFGEERAEAIIQSVSSFYSEKKTEWCWCVSSADQPRNLPKHLERAGLKWVEKVPRMGIDLSRFTAEDSIFDVREVLTERDFTDWAKPIRDGFGAKDNKFAFLLAQLPFGPEKSFRHYVAYQDSSPVSCCTISVSQYGSRLDNLATVSAMRGRGFGTAVIRRALLDAKKAEVQSCFLDSSADGVSIYSRLGFKVIDELLIYKS